MEPIEWYLEGMQEGIREIKDDIKELSNVLCSPAATFKPRVFLDGDMWCALYGENIQVGVSGWGKSPGLAVQDFNAQWFKAD